MTIKHQIGQTEKTENNDCMVRALANALDKPYYEIHAALRSMGRRNRRGTPWAVCIKAMLTYGVGMASPVTRRITHARFIAAHPKGKFIAISRTHAWAIKDGVVFDAWCPGPRKIIKCIGVVPS